MSSEHIQGSQEWLDLRKRCIGSSDAAVIMGVSPWCTPLKLWERKLGRADEQEDNMSMYMGRMLEPEAREIYSGLQDEEFFPQVLFHKDYPWMIASMDGLNLDGTRAVEIKCPGKRTHQMAKEGKVPDHYMPQLQHQMAVCDLGYIDYFSFDGTDTACIRVERNDDYIAELIEKEMEFYRCMTEDIAPEPTNRDIEDMTDCHMWHELSDRLRCVERQLSELQSVKATIKEELISIAKGRSCRGHGVVLSRTYRKGSVDYKSIPELNGIDLESYRGPPNLTWILKTCSA